MTKKIFFIFLLALFVCATAFAEGNDRWQWYASTSRVNEYFDTQTLQYDSSTNSAKVWIKITNPDGTIRFMSERNIIFPLKKFHVIKDVFPSNNYSTLNYPSTGLELISPDSPDEALVNKIADRIGIPHIYKGDVSRWKQIDTKNGISYYVATDTIEYDANTGLTSIWFKYINQETGRTKTYLYYCDFEKHLVGTGPTGLAEPVPDTLGEIVYNTAYGLSTEK